MLITVRCDSQEGLIYLKGLQHLSLPFLFAMNRILLENFGDTVIDLLRNELGIRDHIWAGCPLQYVPCRAAKNCTFCFDIKQIYHKRARRHGRRRLRLPEAGQARDVGHGVSCASGDIRRAVRRERIVARPVRSGPR